MFALGTTTCIPLLVVLVVGSPLWVDGCGMTTHNVIANRARQWFYDSNYPFAVDLINSHVDALQGGAPFPDYLYECGPDHDAGEDAHWPPFQAAAGEYIKNTYPQPWNSTAEKLVVFMLGVTSHYIADINWHGLAQVPFGQGFLRTLGSQNYNCSGQLCSTAHTEGDTGGEFVAAFQTDLSFYLPDRWYIPVYDLVAIYDYDPRFVNKTVAPSSIEDCSVIFSVGSIAIKEFGKEVFGPYVSPAPFLPEMYLDYFLGGIDDNAVWTSFMWSRMLDWAINGPPSPPLPPLSRGSSRANPGYLAFLRHLESRINATVRSDLISVERDAVHRGIYLKENRANFTPERMQVVGQAVFDFVYERRKDVVPVRLFDLAREAIAKKIASYGSPSEVVVATKTSSMQMLSSYESFVAPESSSAASAPSAPIAYFGENATQYFGAALCQGDLDGDGSVDLVIGSPSTGSPGDPQRGSVYILYNAAAQSLAQVEGIDLTISGFDDYGRFGTTCVVLDVNLDGFNDLVVSSPSVGGKFLDPVYTGNYTGKVYTFLGSASGVTQSPSVSVVGTIEYGCFGFTLFAKDVNLDGHLDLLVGSPFISNETSSDLRNGAMFLYYSSSTSNFWTSGSIWNDVEADVMFNGPEAFSWFGMSADVWVASNSTILFISAPGTNGGLGVVYGFKVTQNSAELLYSISGVNENAKFGYSISVGKDVSSTGSVLAVGIPSYGTQLVSLEDHVAEGKVVLLSLDKLPLGNSSLNDLDVLGSMVGGDDFMRFGWVVSFYNSSSSHLLVTAPMATEETGLVRIFHGDTKIFEAQGTQRAARFGAALSLIRLSHDETADVAISSPRYTVNSELEMTGKVELFTFI